MSQKNYKEEYKVALINLNKYRAHELFRNFEENTSEIDFIEDIMTPVLEEIGDGWNNGTISLAQVYISAIISEEIVNLMFPTTKSSETPNSKLAIVTLDDYHSLGKKIVYSVLKANKINVLDFGSGLTVDETLKSVVENKTEILIISVLMYPSALKVKELKQKLIDVNLDVKIIVGGAPFRLDKTLWQSIGADAMGDAPMDTVNLVKKMGGL